LSFELFDLSAHGGEPFVDRERMNANSGGHSSLATVYGFWVESYGNRLSREFLRGLRRLAERGFDDPACVVVKTTAGSQSGITHAGGRYVDSGNPYRTEVIRQMRELGMEPPPPPFLLAPGEYTLYHEWGHHIDRIWSSESQEVLFSFRWFSRFYKLGIRPSDAVEMYSRFPVDFRDIRPIDSELDAANAILAWWHVASELLADLFEDWMRGEKKVAWDQCDPKSLNSAKAHGDSVVTTALLPGVEAKDVRAETYTLFSGGLRGQIDVPPVRPGLLGLNTDEIVARFCAVLGGVRAERT